MKLKIAILLLTAVLLVSCSTKRELKYLTEKESIYFYKNSTNPFSGKVFSIDTNFRGKVFISTYYTFRNGIPRGSWKSYGYNKETFQDGAFEPLLEVSELKIIFPNISRVNICKFYEGKHRIIDIYVISKMLKNDSLNFESKKKKVLNFILEKKLLRTEEVQLVNSIEIYSGEF